MATNKKGKQPHKNNSINFTRGIIPRAPLREVRSFSGGIKGSSGTLVNILFVLIILSLIALVVTWIILTFK